MDIVFISELKPFLAAVSEQMELYVPKKSGEYYIYVKYDPSSNKEEEFEDPFYVARREKMFIISSDCFDPRGSCCCTLFGGQSYAEKGFDLNLAKVKSGFIIEAGSGEGKEFLQKQQNKF